ncbi:MAG: lipopolysaccharide biosynthesis protein [Gallionella sp.]|nr:lipopolysaccharide biosynthesis protein [Gallionella sp.]MDD4945621.1 lipopolysaccharide biosynthesis protein [Gallionella sp.]MDD5613321.1 lipopolysaccharide biosynthesis protein [Gallionella sp.]
MSKVRKSIVLSFGQNYIKFVLQFIATIIISRLLTPAEIGIFSVAMVLLGFAHTLRDFGAASYIIQEKELTPDKIRAAFSMTLITAWLMAAVIWLASGYAAEFYREPGVRAVMQVVTLNFILIPFGTIPIAYMQRNMDFEHIALINVISNAVSTMLTIWMAYAGFSYLALAWGSVAGIVCNIILVQVWRPKELPMWPGLNEIRKVISFGSLSSLIMILNDLRQGVPELILGRVSGMAVVGYYGRAMGLLSMFDRFIMSALWGVVLPHFAEQVRKNGAIKESFLNSMTLMTVLAWPFFLSLSLLAEPVVMVLYGEQWAPSIPLLQIICLSAVITSPFLLLSSMMTAIGQMKQNLYLLAIHVPIKFCLIYLAAPYGLGAIGATFIVSGIIDSVVSVAQCRSVLHVGVRDIWRAVRKSAEVAALAAAVPLLIFLNSGGLLAGQIWLQLLLGMATCTLGWLAGIYLFHHPMRKEVGNALDAVKRLLNRGK